MGGLEENKWDAFQSAALKTVAKVICESFPISYLREFEGRETEVSVKTLRAGDINLVFFFLQNEENVGLNIINPKKDIVEKS